MSNAKNVSGLLTYDDVRKQLAGKTAHLLLGNGFSIACNPIFSYGKRLRRRS